MRKQNQATQTLEAESRQATFYIRDWASEHCFGGDTEQYDDRAGQQLQQSPQMQQQLPSFRYGENGGRGRGREGKQGKQGRGGKGRSLGIERGRDQGRDKSKDKSRNQSMDKDRESGDEVIQKIGKDEGQSKSKGQQPPVTYNKSPKKQEYSITQKQKQEKNPKKDEKQQIKKQKDKDSNSNSNIGWREKAMRKWRGLDTWNENDQQNQKNQGFQVWRDRDLEIWNQKNIKDVKEVKDVKDVRDVRGRKSLIGSGEIDVMKNYNSIDLDFNMLKKKRKEAEVERQIERQKQKMIFFSKLCTPTIFQLSKCNKIVILPHIRKLLQKPIPTPNLTPSLEYQPRSISEKKMPTQQLHNFKSAKNSQEKPKKYQQLLKLKRTMRKFQSVDLKEMISGKKAWKKGFDISEARAFLEREQRNGRGSDWSNQLGGPINSRKF